MCPPEDNFWNSPNCFTVFDYVSLVKQHVTTFLGSPWGGLTPNPPPGSATDCISPLNKDHPFAKATCLWHGGWSLCRSQCKAPHRPPRWEGMGDAMGLSGGTAFMPIGMGALWVSFNRPGTQPDAVFLKPGC